MEIDIHQKKISISDKYKIFVNGQQTHTASAKLFRWLSEIHLLELGDSKPKYVIKKKWTLFKVAFNLTKWNNNVFEFRTKKIGERYYCCHVGQDLYEIFGHRGRKYSVYKNNVQIAYWDKKAITWFNGDNYKIIADKDSDYELIISFCLIIDNFFSNNNDNNTMTVDFGNIGPQTKKFDPAWQPKY
jgi:uncharacterized protein YxjI